MKNTRKSRKMHKLLAMVSCALLLVVISVGATVAYLTDDDSVTNTFTVGNVIITLDEAPVDENGDATSGDRVQKNTYKLLPGHDYDKDPTVHVDPTSEDCWLFVEITNEIAAIETKEEGKTIAEQMTAKGWIAIEEGSNIYRYNSIVEADADVVVFETFTIADGVENDELAGYANKTIVIDAYAVQADGFEDSTAAEIWEAAFGA